MSGITAWATWTAQGASVGEPPHKVADGKLAAWPSAPPLSKVHPRARRPHPQAKVLVQLAAAMVGERRWPLLGVAVGTSSGCAGPDREFQQELEAKGAAFGSPSLFVYTLPTAPLGEVSLALGARGPLVSVNAGSASGLQAVAIAAREVDAGRADAMVCGLFELGVGRDQVALFLVERAAGRPLRWSRGFGDAPAGAAPDGALALPAAPSSPAPATLVSASPEGFWTRVELP